MSQQPNPTVLPPCRGNGESCTAPAANPVHNSSGPALTETSLSLNKTSNPISPAEAGVATSTQPDSERCALPTNPHLGTHVSSARLFAFADTRDHPVTAEHEDQRSTGHDQTELQHLMSSDPPVALTWELPDDSHAQDHAVPKSSGHISSTSVPTIASSTNAQMLPPPPGPLGRIKSIWGPGWVHQPEDKWKKSLRRGSNTTVSPRTMPAVVTGGIAQPDTHFAGPFNSLHSENVVKRGQKAGDFCSDNAETEYPLPRVALMAYLDRLAKEKGELALRTGEKNPSFNPSERLIEPVYPPVKWDATQGRRRVMCTYDQSETEADVDLAEPKRGPPRDYQPGLERTAYPILPSFAHMLESAGLTNDNLPLLPWETSNSSGDERSDVTARSQGHDNSAGSLLQQRSRKMSAINRKLATDMTQDEFILHSKRGDEQRELEWAAYVKQFLAENPEDQAYPYTNRGMVDAQVDLQPTSDGHVHQREHLLATNFNQSVANLLKAQVLPTTTGSMSYNHLDRPLTYGYGHVVQRPPYEVNRLDFYPPSSVPATNQGMSDAQLQLHQIEANHLRRRDTLNAQYIRKHFKSPMDSLPEAQEVPAVGPGQPSDSLTATHLQHDAPAYLERYAPPDIQHASPTPLRSNYLDRYAPAHIQDALKDAASSHLDHHAPSHLQGAAPTHLGHHASSHLQRAASQRSSDDFAYFDEFRFDPEPQNRIPGFGLDPYPSKASYGHSAQQISRPFAMQGQGGNNAPSSTPQGFFRPSFVHSSQQSSVAVASQGPGEYQASSPAPQKFFRPSFVHSAQQSSISVASQGVPGEYQASSSAPQPSFHLNNLQSSYSRVQSLQPEMQQGLIKPSAPLHTGLLKHERTESDTSQHQTDVQSGYGYSYGQDVESLNRVHGQSVGRKSLQPNMAHDNWGYGQSSFANPSFQTTLQPYQSHGDSSLAGNSQPNAARPIPVSHPSPSTNLQTQETQSQQHPHSRPVARGRAKGRSTRRSQDPAMQIPLYVPPDWNQQPGATVGNWSMQQYPSGSFQQPQQQAPYGPTDAASSSFTVGPANQTPSVGPSVHKPVEPRYNYHANNSMAPSKRIRLYRPGGDAMYPHLAPGASDQYQALTHSGRPSLEVAAQGEAMPFVEASKELGPAEWGVIKIGNIPYTVTKQEIMAFLGRNAKIITPDLGVAIHIIMERSTSKTMDCFVELFSYGDALAVVNKFTRSREDGRHPRVGDRHVAVEMSGQDALMKELFPRAKNVVWQGGKPIITQNDEPFNSGFKSFLTSEEMVMLVKHAEQPHRSPFSQKCLQRTYESLISTLDKYPWWCTHVYTVRDRDLLFGATEQQIRALVTQLKRGGAPGLTLELLTQLVYAALNAPGFSDSQRAKLVAAAEPVVQGIRISPLAAFWPFEVLSRREGIQEDVVEYYAGIIREATTSTALAPFSTTSAHAGPWMGPSPFGNVTVPWPVDKGSLKMAVAATLEWSVLEALLRKVLGGGPDLSASG